MQDKSLAISGCQRVSLMSQVCQEVARNDGGKRPNIITAYLPKKDDSLKGHTHLQFMDDRQSCMFGATSALNKEILSIKQL